MGADLDFSGDPAATAVEVDYPPGAAGDRGVSGYHRAVAEVVWRSSPFRVDLLEVRVDNDPSPGSDSYTGDRETFSAAELTSMFGPRRPVRRRADHGSADLEGRGPDVAAPAPSPGGGTREPMGGRPVAATPA